jgi:sulfur carrier protein ThiS
MRMHRGSSKGAGGPTPPPEALPLSASGAIGIEVEVARAGRTRHRHLAVAPGTLVKELVRATGASPEGVAVLVDGRSIPLDTPLERPVRLVIVPTFSGG